MRNSWHKKLGKRPVSRRDLVEMVIQPLAFQINELGIEILWEIRKVLDSVEIIARHFPP